MARGRKRKYDDKASTSIEHIWTPTPSTPTLLLAPLLLPPLPPPPPSQSPTSHSTQTQLTLLTIEQMGTMTISIFESRQSNQSYHLGEVHQAILYIESGLAEGPRFVVGGSFRKMCMRPSITYLKGSGSIGGQVKC
ncbi:hypothetical protein M9H77_31594 [Catharanthus roseus]|uniref:Uncharacterized protein n=1 Tax=Catharanthus roseus TaxID=4058 RepID=A0ACC0A379_CATRO|nr:hypothetical protein M9H77_31594 [Catharanthus roseus]